LEVELMKCIRKSICLAVAAAAIVIVAHGATRADTVITSWDFQNYAPGSGTYPASPINSPAPDGGAVGIGTATPLGMTNNYTYPYSPPTVGSNAWGDITVQSGSSTDPSNTSTTDTSWRVRGETNTAGPAGSGNGWNSAAPQLTQGGEFAVPTTGYQAITFTYDWFNTKQSVSTQVAQYTLDGTNWTNVETSASVAGVISGTYADASYYMRGLPNAYNNGITIDFGPSGLNIPGVNNDPNFAVRLVSVWDPAYSGTGAPTYTAASGGLLNNTSGNWRFDNVIVTGTAIPTPEPASIALAVFGLVGLGLYAVRRRRPG
jgi:MYXO-CTERM domain-containing protein